MDTETLWGRKLTMLMACASPGSALAYHLGLARNQSELLHRIKERDARPVEPAPASNARSGRRSLWGWLAAMFASFGDWPHRQEARARERYLTQAQSIEDLEARMRHLDRGRRPIDRGRF